MVYVEMVKGSGKLLLVVGIGMKGFVVDGELCAEVYLVVMKKD